MINSPFIEEIHSCRGSMKKLRKKIYKYNINKYVKPNRHESTIKDALNVLGKRNIPHFLIDELEKYSDFTFSALSGFSLEQVKPLS
jgi:CHAD domain-containing protein